MAEPDKKFMQAAIKLAKEGMDSGNGGPFGCVIVKDNEIIAGGFNRVTSDMDPTAHAEVVAIREACKKLNTFQLEDCDVYTSCEPCPMCMGAIYWARPKNVYFACTRLDAANAGFDDSLIYNELLTPLDDRKIKMTCIERAEAVKVFEEWSRKTDKTRY
jgi:tRNA(Arg) A34 adenosine deaminase TadA